MLINSSLCLGVSGLDTAHLSSCSLNKKSDTAGVSPETLGLEFNFNPRPDYKINKTLQALDLAKTLLILPSFSLGSPLDQVAEPF